MPLSSAVIDAVDATDDDDDVAFATVAQNVRIAFQTVSSKRRALLVESASFNTNDDLLADALLDAS